MSEKSSNLSLLRNPVVNRLRDKPDSPVTKGLTFLLKSWRCVTTRPVNRVINLERLLCGGENGLSARQYAEHTGNFLRPSTPFARSPHVRFLEQYKEVGDEIFRPEVFRRTAYFANAVECMRSEEHTPELQSHSFISYAVFCLQKKMSARQATLKHCETVGWRRPDEQTSA